MFPNKIEVNVSDSLIELGRPDSEQFCPIALAFREVFTSKVVQVWVVGKWGVVESEEGMAAYILPDWIRDWMWEFDTSGVGDPVEFAAVKDAIQNLRW